MSDQFESLERFDGAAAWATLTPDQQAEIGAIALEYVVNTYGEDAYFAYVDPDPEVRPFVAARSLLMDELMRAVADAIGDTVPALVDDELEVPIPSLLGPVCRVCRCSQEDGCPEGCGWAEPDLCTACKAAEAA